MAEKTISSNAEREPTRTRSRDVNHKIVALGCIAGAIVAYDPGAVLEFLGSILTPSN
ncbi:MAG: hypothetical protein H6799_00415 [Candidatus Nomurabacteria bacterium]|nr:MAG: hypothetical protein H6799_00415 [Candidatus Nomurabacteria bacterium]